MKMKQTIIAVYGRGGEGKSTTVKNTCRTILRAFPGAIPLAHNGKPVDYRSDILVAIKIGKIKIGIESQGDPGSRMLRLDTLRYLADSNFQIDGFNSGLGDCQIIVCAARTSGVTVFKVDKIAGEYGYRTLWKSSYYTPDIDHAAVNQIAADEIVTLIKLITSNLL